MAMERPHWAVPRVQWGRGQNLALGDGGVLGTDRGVCQVCFLAQPSGPAHRQDEGSVCEGRCDVRLGETVCPAELSETTRVLLSEPASVAAPATCGSWARNVACVAEDLGFMCNLIV